MQIKKNTLYYFHWNDITINIVFLFTHDCLIKISDFLNLEMLTCTTDNHEQTGFQLSKKGPLFILKKSHPKETFQCRTVDELIMQTVNQLSWCFLEKSKQLTLHGGAIVVNGEAVLFSGLPHAGKSSLATYAWLQNYPVVGDDILVCDPKYHTVSAFPRPLRPRLSSLNIPKAILNHAGRDNLMTGKFSCDIGLFIGRKSHHIVAYHDAIKIKALYYIERSDTTGVRPIGRSQALTIALTQTYPNQHCLQIAEIVNYLSYKNAIKHLTIGHNAYQQALEIISE